MTLNQCYVFLNVSNFSLFFCVYSMGLCSYVDLIRASLLATEILGAFISVISIWIVTGALVYLAIERIVRSDYEIDGRVMLITSGCAVVVNIM